MSRSDREYTLEELIPFGGGQATQAANRAELARLRAIERAAVRVIVALQIDQVKSPTVRTALFNLSRATNESMVFDADYQFVRALGNVLPQETPS